MTDAMHPAERVRALQWQRSIGLLLAAAIIGAWLAVHIWTVFLLDVGTAPLLLVGLVVPLQTWLSVGLFIVAHDAMHGSLAPFQPRLNRAIGRGALALFASLSYDRMLPKHHAHHRHAGTDDDPDFDAAHPSAFLPWFAAFARRHVGWRELAAQTIFVWIYIYGFGVAWGNLLLFWALPALLATVQLFYFGTYRPHRHDADPFTDRHRTRSETFPTWLSVLTCYNFGYHHEHHDAPQVPWWRLPAERRARRP
jgi:beta-carotene/zeaxanthin 4-ketolase